MNELRGSNSVDQGAKSSNKQFDSIDSLGSSFHGNMQGSGGVNTVNVTDFAGAITSGNINRVYHNITLNTDSVMQDDSRHEPKISNFTGAETGGDKSSRQNKRGGWEQMLPHEIKLADMHMKRHEKEFTVRRGDGLFFDR